MCQVREGTARQCNSEQVESARGFLVVQNFVQMFTGQGDGDTSNRNLSWESRLICMLFPSFYLCPH
jgi:hypothetical protein